ncbi:MAG: TetR/AcrR family transcriptional regulator [Chloroflexota bacterium]
MSASLRCNHCILYGFKKVNLNETARKADVSQVTIYHHFGSKERLVRDGIRSFSIALWNNSGQSATAACHHLQAQWLSLASPGSPYFRPMFGS